MRKLLIIITLQTLIILSLLFIPNNIPKTWSGSYENASCLYSCCLITKPFFELSCNEYHP